jgi:hypothetical protein
LQERTAAPFSKKDSHSWLSFEMQTKRKSENMNEAKITNRLPITAANRKTAALLLCGGSFCGGVSVFLGETFDAACGVQELLFAREERMAIGTDFHAKHIALYGGASREIVPAGAVDGN